MMVKRMKLRLMEMMYTMSNVIHVDFTPQFADELDIIFTPEYSVCDEIFWKHGDAPTPAPIVEETLFGWSAKFVDENSGIWISLTNYYESEEAARCMIEATQISLDLDFENHTNIQFEFDTEE